MYVIDNRFEGSFIHTPGWFVVLAEEIKTIIRNRYSTLVWVDGAEWEVLCRCLTFGQDVKESGFPVDDRGTE